MYRSCFIYFLYRISQNVPERHAALKTITRHPRNCKTWSFRCCMHSKDPCRSVLNLLFKIGIKLQLIASCSSSSSYWNVIAVRGNVMLSIERKFAYLHYLPALHQVFVLVTILCAGVSSVHPTEVWYTVSELRDIGMVKKAEKWPPLNKIHKLKRQDWAKKYLKTDFFQRSYGQMKWVTLDGPDGWACGWITNGHREPLRVRRQQGGGGGTGMGWNQ